MNVKEIFMIAEAISKEKQLDREDVLVALEEGLAVSLRKKFPLGAIVKVEIDSNEIKAYRQFNVVDEVENSAYEVEDTGQKEKVIKEYFTPEFGRQQFVIARQVINQKLQKEAKFAQIDSLLNKDVKVFTGTVRSVKKEIVNLDVNGADLQINRANLLSKDKFKPNDKVSFTLIDTGEEVYASRTAPEFIKELFKKEIYQIEEGDISVEAIARIPGFKSKVVVKAKGNVKIDPVRTCIGQKNNNHIKRIQGYVNNEIIEVIKYDDNLAQYFTNVINTPVERITIDEDQNLIEASMEDLIYENFNKQNIKLAEQILGWKINVITESEWIKKEEESAINVVSMFMEKLNVDQELGETLYENGFSTLEEIAYVPASELLDIDGLDEELVDALRDAAKNELVAENIKESMRVHQELVDCGLTEVEIVRLQNNGIKNKVDVADCSSYDLQDVLTEMPDDRAKSIVMKARELA